ncbi:MAG: rhomboid family intramembrane serine protease [Planctomycetota bacterium]|jgi:membrane associated rhomboid family serine protease
MPSADDHPRFSFAEPLNATMVTLLLVLTVVFLLQMLVSPLDAFARRYLAMNTATFLSRLYLWQAVTAIFLHGGICHFISNMIFLWFFGSALSNAWRRREFLGYFFMCGIAGSLCFYAFNVLRAAGPEGIKGLGASGAVFGVMIAYAMVFGERVILAFFLIPMRAKFFVAICFGIEILLLWQGTPDGVSHVAHVGGAVGGAITLKVVWRRQDGLAGPAGKAGTVASRIKGLEIMDDDG